MQKASSGTAKQVGVLSNPYADAEKIIARLKETGLVAAAEMLEKRILGGATGTEILMGLSSGMTRIAFKEKGVPWRLRWDLLVLSWRMDSAIRVGLIG